MSIWDDVQELLDPGGLQIKPFVKRDPNGGAPIYGSPVTYKPALALMVDRRVKQANGDTVLLTVEAYVAGTPLVDKRSLLIFAGKERKIFDVALYPDPDPSWEGKSFQVIHAQ